MATLQIVDEFDLATILFDLSDPTGTNNADYGSVKTFFALGGAFALNAPEVEAASFAPQEGLGGMVTFFREALTQSSWGQRITATSYDNLVTGVGRLAQLLRRGGVLRWIPDGSANTRYIDFEPSGAPALISGKSFELLQVISHFDSADGVTVVITRQPGLRGPLLDSSTNKVPANPSLLLDSGLDGRPNSWAWSSVVGLSAEAITHEAYAFTFNNAGGATSDLQQSTGAASAAAGDVWTLSFEARLQPAGSNIGAAQARAVTEFQSAALATLQTDLGALVTLTSAWQRVTKITAAAPASTDRIRMSLRAITQATGASDFELRRVMLEKQSSVRPYVDASVVVKNDPANDLGRTIPIFIQGDLPAPVAFSFSSPDASPKLAEVIFGKLWDRGGSLGGQVSAAITDFLNSTHFAQCDATGNGWTVALGTDTTAVPDLNASGGNTAQCTFASGTGVMSRRARITRTSLLDSMRGTWDVYARVEHSAASISDLQLRWGPGSADPAPFSEVIVQHDTSTLGTPTTFDYVEKYLGRIVVPSRPSPLGMLALEVHARRVSGTGNLLIDCITFVPVDPRPVVSSVQVPSGSVETWLGKDLINPAPGCNPGTVVGNDLKLSATNQGGSAPSASGSTLIAGRHTLSTTFLLTLNNGNVVLRARKASGAAPNAWAASTAYALGTVIKPQAAQLNSRTFICTTAGTSAAAQPVWPTSDGGTITDGPTLVWTETTVASSTSVSGASKVTLQFDAVAGQNYDYEVTFLVQGLPVYIHTLTHTFVPFAAQNEQLLTDPSRWVAEKRSTTGDLLSSLSVVGPTPALLEPGFHVLVVQPNDVPLRYYSERDSVLGRTLTVSWTYSPRYLQ